MDVDKVAALFHDPQATAHISVDWSQVGAVITAVGALGLAAFGVTEALGKVFTIVYTDREPGRGAHARTIRLGLPYVGFNAIRQMVRPLGPALECAYGANYLELIAQQYRADRGAGRAPDMIREGVKLGLPFLSVDAAEAVIDSVWRMEPGRARALAEALQAGGGPTPPPAPAESGRRPRRAVTAEPTPPQLLAGRFATALNERVTAAFMLADERYEAFAKMLAGVTAVVLALVFNASLNPRYSWGAALMIGLVAVPLAPVAKDLSTSLQNALTAFKSIPTRRA